MLKYFKTPSRRERPNVRHGLWSRTHIDVGITVLKKDGFYRQVIDPDPVEISDADIAYPGGYIYPITDEEAAALTAAGYGGWVVDNPNDPVTEIDYSLYGVGAYGTGPYGD